MADLTQTASSVAPGTPAFKLTGIVNAAVVAGQPCYQGNDGYWYPAVNDSALHAGSNRLAIALDSAPGAGQPVTLLTSGQMNLGATLTVGETYVVSKNTGKIAPISDLIAGNFVSILGVAISTTILETPPSGPFASGVTHA